MVSVSALRLTARARDRERFGVQARRVGTRVGCAAQLMLQVARCKTLQGWTCTLPLL